MCSWMFVVTIFFEIIFASSILFSASATNPLVRQKRIINGEELALGEQSIIKQFPFMASVQVTKLDHVCGGSIISEYHVVTAADCMRTKYETGNNTKKFWVRVGSHAYDWGGTTHRVKNWTIHPENSTENTTHRDFALLRLEDPIEFDNATKLPIGMFEPDEEIKNRSVATTAGWGCINAEQYHYTNQLRSLKMEVIDKGDCQVMNNNSMGMAERDSVNDLPFGLQEGEICAEGVSANYTGVLSLCDEDEGAPLVIDGRLAGIAVRIVKYDIKRWHTTFVEVAHHRKWIDEQLAF